ncbi:hypothetical protein CHCC20335_0653 [Bacillus paralicheniformis]|nr:hypothetical protein CHCC20335_0653 [Bacillus paralicheniformis]
MRNKENDPSHFRWEGFFIFAIPQASEMLKKVHKLFTFFI